MQCVILAGGLGTRMRPFTETAPKSLILAAGRPFVSYQLDWAHRHGVTDVVFSIGYRGEMIRAFVEDGSAWHLRVRYVEDGEVPMGTAGGLRRALEAGLLDDTFLVQYGDSFLPFDYRRLRDAFARDERPAMMTVFHNAGRWVPGNVRFENGTVVTYDKAAGRGAPDALPYLDYGLTVLRRQAISDFVPPNTFCDLAEVYRTLSNLRLLAGFEADERFYEVGSPAGLSDFECWLETARP